MRDWDRLGFETCERVCVKCVVRGIDTCGGYEIDTCGGYVERV